MGWRDMGEEKAGVPHHGLAGRSGRVIFGGGGGALRHSTNAQTATAKVKVASAPTTIRAGVGGALTRAGYSSTSVSIFSATSKSMSVRPPSLCVDRRSVTLP